MGENKKPAKGAKAPSEGQAKQAGAGKSEKQAKGQKAAKSGAPEAAAAPRPKDYRPRMKTHYEKVVRDALLTKFEYANPMQVPKIEKIVLNMGIGEGVADRKKVDNATGDLALISGQKPVQTKARRALATYKLREGMVIGAKVTLRGDRMYNHDRAAARERL